MMVLKDWAHTWFNPVRVTRVKRNAAKDLMQVSGVIIVALVASAIGAVFFYRAGPERRAGGTRQPPAMINSPTAELTFRQIAVFDGRTDDGVPFSEQQYKASDCVSLSYVAIVFRSSGRALEEVQTESQKAAQVLSRDPVLDDKGQRIGERVVMQFADHAKVVAYKGPDFLSITSSSLHHVLEFEKSSGSPNNRKVFPGIDSVKGVAFEMANSNDGSTKEGVPYREEQIRASDCETLVTSTHYFGSPAGAEAEMQKKLKETTNLIEQGPKLDATGQQVGQRVVAMFKASPNSEHIEDTMVIWTENSELHSIRGLFTHVLEFEKRRPAQVLSDPIQGPLNSIRLKNPLMQSQRRM